MTFVWFSILGGVAINLQLGGTDLAGALEQGQETALFALLREFPWFAVTAFVVVLLVAFFFISGADAASLVMATLSCRGCQDPRGLVTVFWGVMTGAVAGILLMAGGLQALCILAAFPFMFVMLGAAVGLMKELRNEPDPAPHPGRRKQALIDAAGGAAVDAAVEARVAADGAGPFASIDGAPTRPPVTHR